jgi:transcriptional regulator with XRE-family HTH domain
MFGKMNAVFAKPNDTSAGGPGIGAVLSANLRRLRIARQLSLSELARATGVGKATLSAIENDNANPTVGTLTLLAAALRVRPAELIEEPELGEVRVVRASRAGPAADDGVVSRTIDTFAADGALELRALSLPPRSVHELEPGGHGSREEVVVLEGTLIAGPVERITELSKNDYASFPADVARQYEAGRDGARALVLVHV